MAGKAYIINVYIDYLLDKWVDWNINVFKSDVSIACSEIRTLLEAGSDNRTRAAEMHRLGLLKLKLSRNIEDNDISELNGNLQSDLGFLAALLSKDKNNNPLIKKALGAISAIFSLMQSVTIGEISFSINFIIHKLLQAFPPADNYDRMLWTRYLLSAFFCEMEKLDEEVLKNFLISPTNAIKLRLIENGNQENADTLRAEFTNSKELAAIIDNKISLTNIYHQKRPLFLIGDNATANSRGVYSIGEAFFPDFLTTCFNCEDKNKQLFAPLFDDAPNSQKANSLNFLKHISENDPELNSQFKFIMKTIEEGAIAALANLTGKSEEEYLRSIFQDTNEDTPIQGDLYSLQRIYYGAPGTGKSHLINKFIDPDRTMRITFHPETDYSTFVGAYKPVSEDVRINVIKDGKVSYAIGENGHSGTESRISYCFAPQAFLLAYIAAWTELDKPHYLIIEEINRGNCAQIFGDIFQLLDRDDKGYSVYSITPESDITRYLAKKGFANLPDEIEVAIPASIRSGEKLILPPNFHIWATMNTSDQSLFPMDTAFKRRWDWIYVPITYDDEDWLFEINGELFKWSSFLKNINSAISNITGSSDRQLGFYFVRPNRKTSPDKINNNLISGDCFLNKVIFYIWNDALKNFDMGQNEIFINPTTSKIYEFSDFFDDGQSLIAFVKGLINNEDIN